MAKHPEDIHQDIREKLRPVLSIARTFPDPCDVEAKLYGIGTAEALASLAMSTRGRLVRNEPPHHDHEDLGRPYHRAQALLTSIASVAFLATYTQEGGTVDDYRDKHEMRPSPSDAYQDLHVLCEIADQLWPDTWPGEALGEEVEAHV